MKFADVQEFLQDGLTARDYNPLPVIDPGPGSTQSLQSLSAGQIVFVSVGGGAGLTAEYLFDRVFITLRTIGNQSDYEDAEKLAYDCDAILLSKEVSQVGDAKTLYLVRSGGAPQVIDFDSGNRHHFQCTYLAETQTGY